MNRPVFLAGNAIRLAHAPRIRASAKRMRDSRMDMCKYSHRFITGLEGAKADNNTTLTKMNRGFT